MSIIIIAKIFAWVLLCSPLVLIAVSLICAYLPAVAQLLSTIFWELLGEFEIFALASQLLQNGLSQQHFTGENFLSWVFTLLLDAMLEALVLGCCVFALKATNMRFGQKFKVLYSRPLWLLTLLGVVLGVLICKALEHLGPTVERLIPVLLYIACLLYGLRLMMHNVTTPGGKYFQRKWGFFASLLLDIFCNMVNAVSGVLILTCFFEGPRFIQAGGTVKAWLAWIGFSVAVMYFMHLVAAILKPKSV